MKKIFTDNISIETMAELTDELLKFERTAPQRTIKSNLLKIVPAAAAVLLVVSLLNILPMINFSSVGESLDPLAPVIRDGRELSEMELTDIPRIIERQTFESLIERIPEDAGNSGHQGRVLAKFQAYYSLKDISDPHLSDEAIAELLSVFPIIEQVAIYVFDTHASEREIEQMLNYWNEYIGWSDADQYRMIEAFGLGETEIVQAEIALQAHKKSLQAQIETELYTWTWLRLDENGGQKIILEDGSIVAWVTMDEFNQIMYTDLLEEMNRIKESEDVFSHITTVLSPEGEIIGAGFGSDCHETLLRIIEMFVDAQLAAGNITQEEAYAMLADTLTGTVSDAPSHWTEVLVNFLVERYAALLCEDIYWEFVNAYRAGLESELIGTTHDGRAICYINGDMLMPARIRFQDITHNGMPDIIITYGIPEGGMRLDKIYTFDFGRSEFVEIYGGQPSPMLAFYVNSDGQRFAAALWDNFMINAVWAVETDGNGMQFISLTEHSDGEIFSASQYDDIWSASQLDPTLIPLEIYDLSWILDDARARLR